jgi:superfamily II DNA or RNA helicase
MARTRPIATIKIFNEVDVAVIGLRPTEYFVLSDMYALKTAGYFFNPKFTTGGWDGFKRFFTVNGKTSIHLLPEIIPVLTELGYDFKLIDKRDKINIKIPHVDSTYLSDFGWTLEDHQVEVVNTLIENRGGMIKAGTGAGKTACCWVLHDIVYKHTGFETLVIVPTSDLIHQTVAEFNKFSDDVGLWGDSHKDTAHPIVVSTWQTLQNQPGFVAKYKHMIMDECHGGRNFESQVNKILNDYGKNCYIKSGMTGTFPEHPCELRTLFCAMGPVRYEVSARELIDIGWLAELTLKIVTLIEDFEEEYQQFLKENEEADEDDRLEGDDIPNKKEFTKMMFPEYPHETKYISTNEKRNEFIANLVIGKAESMKGSGNSVVLVNTVKHGKALEKLIPNSKFIYGKDKTKVRKEMFDLFSVEDDVTMITTFGLAAIGLNIPRIFNVYMIDAGKSFIRVIQTIGRGLRKAHDKNNVNIFDVNSNLHYSNQHLNKRKKFYGTENHPVDEHLLVDYKLGTVKIKKPPKRKG